MPAEGIFLFGSKDADLDAFFFFDGRIAREDEGSFLQTGFAGDGLHFVVGEAASVRKDGEGIAFEAARSEDVDLYEAVFAQSGRFGSGERRETRLSDRGCGGDGSGLKECAAGRFQWKSPFVEL